MTQHTTCMHVSALLCSNTEMYSVFMCLLRSLFSGLDFQVEATFIVETMYISLIHSGDLLGG